MIYSHLFIRAVVFFFFLSIITPFAAAQFSHAQRTGDEVLLFIPADQVQDAQRIATFHIRFYQRFPEFYIAGTSREIHGKLVDAKMNIVVLDENPWTAAYAVVSPSPGKTQPKNYSTLNVRILASAGDLDIVKGSPHSFEVLRQNGFSCVEIERKEIPVKVTKTYLSPRDFAPPDEDIRRIISYVSDSTITSYIQGMQNFGTRYAMNANRDSVFRWVRQRFLDAGVTNVVFDSFQYSGTWQKNVIATIPGTVNPNAEIIVGGHLDSYSSNLLQAPGADDNASGTTSAIEMARVLVQANYQPNVTLRFIGFAAEEVGLRGSADYALKARQQNRDIKVMMNYDMIGYRNQSQPDRDFYIVWYPGSEAFSNLHAAMSTVYTTLTPVFTTSYRSSSDSWSFYQQGYNTVFAIERDFNPYYHSPNDLLQYLDIPYARDIIKAGLAMVLTLDALPPSVPGLRVADRGDGTSLFVQWDSIGVTDWYRYKVYVGTQPGVYTSNYLQTTRSRMLTGLTTGTRYYIGVTIVDLAGNEGLIVEQSEMPLLIPRRPQSIAAENIENGIRITWQPNSEMDLRGYNIYRSVNSDTSFNLLNSQPVRDTLWVDTQLPAGTYYYYARAVDSSNFFSEPSDTVFGSPIIVGVAQDGNNSRPLSITLHANYPNPFNPTTNLRFRIADFSSEGGSASGGGFVSLKVYDLLGREIATLVNEEKAPGTYTVIWDATGIASGVYYAVLQVGSQLRQHQMILLR